MEGGAMFRGASSSIKGTPLMKNHLTFVSGIPNENGGSQRWYRKRGLLLKLKAMAKKKVR
ncbi:hypothetical protein D3H55_07175 [Bacillus salacetis]|uniref:Uncharacterized protein n=1 Tax=Bacillus salacetis TaxID=2315464 RepID=A0A3A1R7L4_9BACI|nr:hypothetical protein [Bacillus salacetis]RIW35657.1 hypothetical protein D3H55_07175 [Bacillus salacetis]